jgi:DNA-directed RNA polymerase subunit RPC12/RpoP
MVPGTKLILVSRDGKELNQKREVVQVLSNGLAFKGEGIGGNGISWMTFPKASYIKFTDDGFEVGGLVYKFVSEKNSVTSEAADHDMDAWMKRYQADKERKANPQNLKDVEDALSDIEMALSPENLSHDGELSRSETERERRRLTKERQRLMQLKKKFQVMAGGVTEEKEVIGKQTEKLYKCATCGHTQKIKTNHYGDCYSLGTHGAANACPNCHWKHPLEQTVWKCQEKPPMSESEEINVGDTVKVDMGVVTKHGNHPNYLGLVRSAIKDGNGRVTVSEVNNGMVRIIGGSRDRFLGGPWVPIDALRKMGATVAGGGESHGAGGFAT